ncbi:hypothetical protein CK934_13610 [Chitinophaga sp. MD30]|nr:hypothetical protein CK934_13610 [Chitinophaga sp. MD30]
MHNSQNQNRIYDAPFYPCKEAGLSGGPKIMSSRAGCCADIIVFEESYNRASGKACSYLYGQGYCESVC